MTNTLRNRLIRGLSGLVFFDSDGGAGSGGGAPSGGSGGDAGGSGSGDGSGAGRAPAGGDQGGDGGKPGDQGDPPAGVNLTQEQLDALISKRIGAARAGWEKDLGSYAEAENETAQQKAEREAQEARQQAAQATDTANATLRRAEATIQAGIAGIKPDRIAGALAIAASDAKYSFGEVEVKDGQVDASAMAKVMEAIAKDYPEFKNQGVQTPGAAGASTSTGGDNGGEPPAGQPKTLQDAVAARLAKGA